MKNLKLDFPVEMVLKHINDHSTDDKSAGLLEYNQLTESKTFKLWSLFWIMAHGRYQQHLKNSFITDLTEVKGLREWCKRYNADYRPLDLMEWSKEQVCNYCYDHKCSYSIELLREKHITIEKYDYVLKAPQGFQIGIRTRYPGSATDSYLYAEFGRRGVDRDYLPNHQLLYYVVVNKDAACLKFMLETMDSYELIKSLQPWFENECTVEDCIEEARSYEYNNIEMLQNMPKITNIEVVTEFFNMLNISISPTLVEIMQSTGVSMFDAYDTFMNMDVSCETSTKLPELGL